VDDVLGRLKSAIEGEDVQKIKQLSEELTQSSHKLAEALYQQASKAGQDQAGGPDAEGSSAGVQPDEDVVDADFEEVKEDK